MIHLLTTYTEAWESMFNDCQNAKDFIYFEQFILKDFEPGQIGYDFLKVLKQKSKDGVRVKILLDSAGSFDLYLDTKLQDEIRNSGIELEFFNIVPRWKALFPFNIIHRDHRKVLIIDNEIAHIGGVVIQEESRQWYDINARIHEPLYVTQLKGAFLRMFDEITEEKIYENEYDTNEHIILKTDPENTKLYDEIYERIKQADSRIVIITPYFSPDTKVLKALFDAHKRGVIIDIILPKESDSKIIGMVADSYMYNLHKHKINIYLYNHFMNHGKLVLIDEWVTFGSMNFDRLSFFIIGN